MKILVVEDDPTAKQEFEDDFELFKKFDDPQESIEYEFEKSLEAAERILDKTFDGAIIDLKLEGDGKDAYSGNDLIEIISSNYRIPIFIFTSTPRQERPTVSKFSYPRVRGDSSYREILNELYAIYQTGVTRILGGRGAIENAMDDIFWQNIQPTLDVWQSYVKSGTETEKAILRYTVNHLLELLEDDSDLCFPEEMYLHPPISSNIKTGSIVVDKETNNSFVILSPACDLAVHNGQIKTDRILACAIEKQDNSLLKGARKSLSAEVLEDDDASVKEKKQRKKLSAQRIFEQLPRNNYTNYYHYLPGTSYFDGGIINFRKINTYSPKEFKKKFEEPKLQISGSFTKDIVARFSSYYARQGQPDFDFNALSEKLLNN